MKRYAHGGDIEEFKRKTGCKEVLDLSSNINFIKPNVSVDLNSLKIDAYPNYDELKKLLAKTYGIKPKHIELFNGATSAITSLIKGLDYKRAYIYAPAYVEYKRVLESVGKKTIMIDRFKELYQDIKRNSLVIFVNPSTPDGKYYDLDRLFDIWMKKDATIMIDESFLEFCEGCSSATKFLKSYKKLYIIKSMTKFYSSAGVRVGLVISSAKNIKKLLKSEPLWKISEFDKAYMIEALKDREFREKSLKANKKNKELLIESLKKNRYIKKIYKSDANFVLVKLGIKAKEFQKSLENKCIMIRDCSNFDFLDEYHVRIAVKSFMV